MAIRIGSNISSLHAQRNLAEGSAALSKVYERLSSGQRINRAGDDAAGLSIVSSLGVGKRVFAQGVRNLSDGISALSLADSTIDSLTHVVTRIRELAEQAANGSFSSSQRRALDEEAQALQKEYFRISRQASFNGIKPFDGSLSRGLSLQAGFGSDGALQSSLGGVMGSGTFAGPAQYSVGAAPQFVTLGDLNGDGALDLLTADAGHSTVSVRLGRGDGTFFARTSYATGSGVTSISLGDIDGNGVLDMVTADTGSSELSVFLGRGDGTFSARTFYTSGAGPVSVSLGDLNGDGRLDMVSADHSDAKVGVFLGNGDGTFSARISCVAGENPVSVSLEDLNGDGVLDMVTADSADESLSVFLGRGDGTFSAKTSYAANTMACSVSVGDLNGDSVPDLVSVGLNNAMVFLGRGDGTFSAGASYAVGSSPFSVALGDLNGDGALDIATANFDGNGGPASVLLGKGDGSFCEATGYDVGLSPFSLALGDLNGDGVLDMAVANFDSDSASVLLGGTREGIAPLLPFSLATQAGALQALAPLDRKLAQLSSQRGVLGAFQSRLGSAVRTLGSSAENYAAAESRIKDADIASEAAELVRIQIRNQAAAAILGQANLEPGLAISLLQFRPQKN